MILDAYILTAYCGFDDIIYRSDRPDVPYECRPFKDNVVSDMLWLVEDAIPGDVLVFFCA